MKKIIFLMLIPVFGMAQHKYDNAVIVHGVSLDSAISKLNSSGLTIRSRSVGLCLTNPDETNLTIQIKSNGPDLIITGKFYTSYLGTGSGDTMPLQYMKHGTYHDHWVSMMKFAGQFANISYAKL